TERVALPGVADNDRRPEALGFQSAYPGYRSTAPLDQLRATEYPYLDAAGHVYLDYAGAGLAAQAQLAGHADGMRGWCLGNPPSESPAPGASSELIERARVAVLAHFNAPPEEYAAIFRPWRVSGPHANETTAPRRSKRGPNGPRSRPARVG